MDYTEFKLKVRITSSSILQGVERGREEIWFIRSARWRGFWMCRHQRCGIMTKKGCSVRGAFFRRRRILPESVLQGFAEYDSADLLKKLIAVTGFTVWIWIWLLSQQKSVEFHARLIFYVWRIAGKNRTSTNGEGEGSACFYEFILLSI